MMAAMGFGGVDKDKMAAMGTKWPPWGWVIGTRWQPMEHDGRHGVWRGGQGQEGGHGDKMAAMDGHLAKPRA